MQEIRLEKDRVGMVLKCCVGILHNRKWTGRMLRHEIGTWRRERGI